MNTFSNELRKERELKNITLAEIAKKTRINIKYLEAIEQGAFDVLPQTYVRAFLKSYAETIGIPVADTLHRYDIMVASRYFGASGQPANQKTNAVEASPETQATIKKEKTTRHAVMVIGFIAVAALFALYLYDSFDSPMYNDKVSETPFQEVVKDQETKNIPAVDSSFTVETPAPTVPEPDSLVLRLVAADSVWLTIFRDSLPPRSGYLSKGRYRTYIAKKEFRLSFSDASALKLFLNGIELRPFGEKGERVRNVKINSDFLKQ